MKHIETTETLYCNTETFLLHALYSCLEEKRIFINQYLLSLQVTSGEKRWMKEGKGHAFLVGKGNINFFMPFLFYNGGN